MKIITINGRREVLTDYEFDNLKRQIAVEIQYGQTTTTHPNDTKWQTDYGKEEGRLPDIALGWE
jgi:hypothetical protein